MFIKPVNTWYDNAGSHSMRGDFLLFCQGGDVNDPIKCCVRKVALHQLGCWMMGTVRIYGNSFTVSGAYGSDGLPMQVPQNVYERLPIRLPDHLREMWDKGGGWNSAGNEGPDVRNWARANLKLLRG